MEYRPPRRYNVPPSVSIPAKFDFIPMNASPCVSKGVHYYFRRPFPVPPPPLELVCFKPSEMYTSLKDLIPYSPPSLISPNSTSSGGAGCQIPIRNRLVKQAAWAYLQPMSISPAASRPHLWLFLYAVGHSVVDWAARVCDCLWNRFG